MKYARYEHIKADAKDVPDATPFVVYREKDQTWAFAMRIKGNFTLTRFQSQNVDVDGVRNAKKQILFCRDYGWSYLGQKTLNTEVDEEEHEFMCLYCGKRTYVTTDPCECRGKKVEDMLRRTESGIILPY